MGKNAVKPSKTIIFEWVGAIYVHLNGKIDEGDRDHTTNIQLLDLTCFSMD